MKKNNSNNCRSSKGFSLIEVLVATFIFVIVLFSAMIIFSDTLKITGKAEQYEKAQESMYYPIELVSREIREAKGFELNNLIECPNGIIITKADSDLGTKSCYFLNNEKIAVKKYVNGNWSSAEKLSSEGAAFSQLRFQGPASSDLVSQPFVQIEAKLKTNSGERKNEIVEMDLQTTVTLRNIDWKFKTNNQ